MVGRLTISGRMRTVDLSVCIARDPISKQDAIRVILNGYSKRDHKCLFVDQFPALHACKSQVFSLRILLLYMTRNNHAGKVCDDDAEIVETVKLS